MAFAYRDLSELSISPVTKYLIGWTNELDDKYRAMILGRRVQTLKF